MQRHADVLRSWAGTEVPSSLPAPGLVRLPHQAMRSDSGRGCRAAIGKMLYSEIYADLSSRAVHLAVKFLPGSQGPPGLVHGGAIVAAFDDCVDSLGSGEVKRIFVEYRLFIQIGETVYLHMTLQGSNAAAKDVLLSASLQSGEGAQGKVFATATINLTAHEGNFLLAPAEFQQNIWSVVL